MVPQILPWFRQPVKAERYKLIGPFVLLTLLLAAALIYLTSWTIAQERQSLSEQQLGLAAAQFNDSLTQQEVLHLASLRILRFTQGMAEAVVSADQGQLLALTFPVAVNQGVDWVIVTDAQGQSLLQLRRRDGFDYLTLTEPTSFDWDIIDKARTGEIVEGNDKFAQIVALDQGLYMLTATGILPSKNSRPVGTVIVGTNLDLFVEGLKNRTQADFTIYRLDGQPQFSTLAPNAPEDQAMRLDQTVLNYLNGSGLVAARSPVPQSGVRIGGRTYDMLVSVLAIGMEPGSDAGFYSVAFPSAAGGVSSSGLTLTLVSFFVLLVLLALNIGYFVSTRLMEPV